ncbi:MAG: DUF1552 domain-containing protein [Pirellulales bacterium]
MKHHLSRRTVLRGFGTSIALPFLEAMQPNSSMALARSTVSKPPLRMAFLYVPNGIHMPTWTPTSEGTLSTLPSTLQPLQSLRSDFSILTGLGQNKANSNGDGPGDHARAMATFLTGMQARKTDGADIKAGISVDQIAASSLGRRTRFPSLEIGADLGKTSGSCDSGYSCVYSSTISWRNEKQPLPKDNDPRVIFERLFENGRPGESAAAREKRDRFSRSILDFAIENARSLESKLGAADRHKLDEYLTSVREVEQRIGAAGKKDRGDTVKMTKPDGIPDDYSEHLLLLADLLFLAFQTDSTRVATFVFANEGSGRSYPSIDVPEGHHNLSHHRNDPEKQSKLAKINTFHAKHLAHLLTRLKNTPEGDTTLLDNSMIVYGGCIGDGNRHDHENLPIMLAGHGGGALNPGRHVVYTPKTPLMDLYGSLLDTAGVKTDPYSQVSGRLDNI